MKPRSGTPRALRGIKKRPSGRNQKKPAVRGLFSKVFFQRGLVTRRSYSAAARAYSTSSSMEVMS